MKLSFLQDFWDTIKQNNTHFIGIPEERKRTESLFWEIMAENFLNIRKDMNIQVHEVQSPQSRSS